MLRAAALFSVADAASTACHRHPTERADSRGNSDAAGWCRHLALDGWVATDRPWRSGVTGSPAADRRCYDTDYVVRAVRLVHGARRRPEPGGRPAAPAAQGPPRCTDRWDERA